MASLYICDLHPDVTEITLFEKFCDVGQIHSIRVCRDDVTRQSLGYAYVKFSKAADAETALYTMNHDPIKGRPIRIVWSHRDPALSEFGVGSIYIDNLDKSIDSKALFDTFSTFGNILFCKVSCLSDVSKGVGFIHFETEEAALRAINKMNGIMLNDKKVFVDKFHFKNIKKKGDRARQQKMSFSEPLTIRMLAAAQPQEQKQMLGERLYPLIESSHPDLASKITGMLLKIDNSELLHMLESRESLKAKVEEAVAVLQAHQSKVAAQARQNCPAQAAHAPVTQKMPTLQNDEKLSCEDGVSKSCDFVHLETEEAALHTIDEGLGPLTASMLAAAQPQKQKQMLGERLYPLIESSHPDLASKITGMLLEIDNSELLHMLESRESLKVMVEESVAVLQTYEEVQDDEKIKIASSDSSATTYPMASLYVSDLHPDVTEAMLYEKFSQAGPVLSIRVCRDIITQRSLGYAYVEFQQPADAESALNTMNNDPIKGRQIFIMWKRNDPSFQKSSVGIIFLKNLDKSIDNKAMYDTFLAFGNILFCKVSCQGGVPNGYGFVYFDTEEAALRAIDKGNGMLINGKKIFVGKFFTRSELTEKMGEEVPQFTNCYIKNFGDKLNEKDLRKMFEKYGTIRSMALMKDNRGKSRGFGFVDFSNHEEAQSAVDALNGTEIENSDKVLYVGRAQNRQERQNELRGQFEQQKQDRIRDVNLSIKKLNNIETVNDSGEAFNQYGTITSARPNQLMNQSFQAAGAPGYFMPFQGALRTYMPSHLIRATPRWQSPTQASFQMAGDIRTMAPPGLSLPTVLPLLPPMGALGAILPTQHVMRPQLIQPFKYTQSVRNPNMAGYPQPGQTQNQQQPDSGMQQAVHVQGQEPLTASMLAAAQPQEQKQMLGERLYPLIESSHSDLTSKITGMLLEIDNSELLHMLESRESLKVMVEEAVSVLQAHQSKVAKTQLTAQAMDTVKLKMFNGDELLTRGDEKGYLGCGKFGSLRICYHKVFGKVVAKCMSLNGMGVEMHRRLESIQQEALANVCIKHPNIVQILGWTKWDQEVAIIQEFVDGGNLKKYLSSPEVTDVPWQERLLFAKQIMSAISYLHNYTTTFFCHCNLKAGNVLLTKQLNVKLTNFATTNIVRTYKGQSGVKPSADIYRFGMVLYEIITRASFPGGCNLQKDTLMAKTDDDDDNDDCLDWEVEVDEVENSLSENDLEIFRLLKTVMQKCWQDNDEDRPTAAEVSEQLESEEGSLKNERTDENLIPLTYFTHPFRVAY